jgi:hypothetical protein
LFQLPPELWPPVPTSPRELLSLVPVVLLDTLPSSELPGKESLQKENVILLQ